VGVGEKFRNSYKVNAAKAFARRVAIDPVIAEYKRFTLKAKVRKFKVLMVHFGCGEIADPRFLNVDARPFQHVDYVTTSPMMPALPARSADTLYACHVFEHIPFKTQSHVLARWSEILKPGGQIMLSVPDFEKVTNLYGRGERDLVWAQYVLMGGQDYPGNFHFALFTARHLGGLLAQAGFTNIREWRSAEEERWPKDWSWDETLSLNLKANKPTC
jgi:predicted SAM-dependent methyltransferase